MEYRARKAVIPAGGLGTRMYPLTSGMPKEMLPIGHWPMIRWCIEEAVQSGIHEIAIVLNRDKRGVRDYLTCPEKSESSNQKGSFQCALNHCLLRFIEQPRPRGSGEAIYRSRQFVGDEPFAVMMPDFVFFDTRPALRQMIEALGQRGESAVGFLRLDWQAASTFGNVGVLETEEIEGPIHRITALSGKTPGTLVLQKGDRVFKAVGRLVLHPDFFDVFDAISWQKMRELDDVPVIQRLAKGKRLLGVHLQGCGFDVGNPRGYDAANKYLKTKGF